MAAKFKDEINKDLFEEFQSAERKIKHKAIFFLPDIKRASSINIGFENIVFLAIVFMMSCVIFFSLGVEKGRNDIAQVKEWPVQVQEQIAKEDTPEHDAIAMEDVIENKKKEEPAAPEIIKPVEKNKKDVYIVQLASYKQKTTAEAESEKLKRAGFKALVRKSGDYYQLYLGNFSQKVDAQKAQKALEKTFRDSYIRKL